MMTQKEVVELKRKAAAIDEDGLGWVSPRMVQMMEYWNINRPKIYREHESRGTLVDLAKVAEMRFIRLVHQAISRGMPESDATREYAEELLMTPESEDFPAQEPDPLAEFDDRPFLRPAGGFGQPASVAARLKLARRSSVSPRGLRIDACFAAGWFQRSADSIIARMPAFTVADNCG